jgi:hypothetical protein
MHHTLDDGEHKSVRERRTIGQRLVKPPAVGRLQCVLHGIKDAAIESVEHDVTAAVEEGNTKRVATTTQGKPIKELSRRTVL